MNNLSNTARKLDKVFEIAHIVLGALAIACVVIFILIGLAFVMEWDPEMIGANYEVISVGFLELTFAEAFAPDKWLVLLQCAIILAAGCRLCFVGRKGTEYIRQILKPMAEETPFDSIVSANLKKLARLSISMGILFNIITLVEQIMVVFVYDLPGLLLSEKVTHVGGMFRVDLNFLIFWAIFTLLSYVFQYGEGLQKLSDETL